MTTLQSFMQTQATIKILQVVQELRKADALTEIDSSDTVEYNKFSGVCYLFLNFTNIAICCDEFGGGAYIEVYNEENDDFDELTVEEYLKIC